MIETTHICQLNGTNVRVKVFNWSPPSKEGGPRLMDLYFIDQPNIPQTNNAALIAFRQYLSGNKSRIADQFLLSVPETQLTELPSQE